MFRPRRHPRVFGIAIGVVVASLLLVVLGLWWSEGSSLPHHHYHHHQHHLETTNVTVFVNGPRHLSLEPLKPLEACKTGIEVVVVVPSSPHNLAARSAVREGWGAYLPTSWALVFYIGAVEQHSVQDLLISESETHKDIAQDQSFPDSYSTLTLKTLALLSWAKQACPTATFVLKVDDDVFLNIPRLHALTKCLDTAMRNLYVTKTTKATTVEDTSECEGVRDLVSHYVDSKTHEYESYVMGGYLYKGVKADRSVTSKWHLPRTSYLSETLPPYLSGTAYLVSANIVPHVLNAAENTPLIHLEDVYLTGLVASEKLKLRLTHLKGFERFRPRFEGPCVFRNLLTAHGFTPAELRVATHTTLALGKDECDGVLTRAGLAVNGVLTSLFPRLPTQGLSDNDVAAVI